MALFFLGGFMQVDGFKQVMITFSLFIVMQGLMYGFSPFGLASSSSSLSVPFIVSFFWKAFLLIFDYPCFLDRLI